MGRLSHSPRLDLRLERLNLVLRPKNGASVFSPASRAATAATTAASMTAFDEGADGGSGARSDIGLCLGTGSWRVWANVNGFRLRDHDRRR
jgi:hypothetical protein